MKIMMLSWPVISGVKTPDLFRERVNEGSLCTSSSTNQSYTTQRRNSGVLTLGVPRG